MKGLFPNRRQFAVGRCAFLVILSLAWLFANFSDRPLYAESPPLTWEACVHEALTRHPDLQAAREKLQQAAAAEEIAGSPALPQISAGLDGGRTDREDQPAGNAYGFNLTGRQLLYDGGRTSHQTEAARAALSAEQFTYDVTSSRIRLNLRLAFIDLMQARELLAISREIAKRRQQNLGLVELRYEAGREHRGSLLSARANVAQAEYDIQSARRAIDLAGWRLAKELGREDGRRIAIAGELTLPVVDDRPPDFEKLALETPFLKELMAQKEIARSDRASVKSDFFPQIFAQASAGRDDSEWPPDQDYWSIGLSLSVPLFEGGSRFSELRKASSRLRQTMALETGGRHEVIYTLFTAWTDLQNAVDKVAVGNAFLGASEERAKITQVEYSNGLISFDNWAIIEDDLERDRKTCLTYLAQALAAHAYWVQAKGETLEYDLEKN